MAGSIKTIGNEETVISLIDQLIEKTSSVESLVVLVSNKDGTWDCLSCGFVIPCDAIGRLEVIKYGLLCQLQEGA